MVEKKSVKKSAKKKIVQKHDDIPIHKTPYDISFKELESEIRSGHKNVLVICSHSDDQILGPGGTLAKLAKDGAKITTIILSFGELTPAWLKDKYTVTMRVNEAKQADKIIGGDRVAFFGLKEGKFLKEAEEKGTRDVLYKLIKKEKPSIIFTHLNSDPQPDHKATVKIVKDVVKRISKFHRPDVFSFNIWNPFNVKLTPTPRMVVDVSDTYKKKMDALMCFKSQRLVILQLMPGVFLGAKFNGWKYGCKYAEVFTKVDVDD